jgi:MoaA/NifB/PqqE/SkfB family radical SAM enzyme
MLEVTNRCNLDCPMCLRKSAEFLQKDMSRQFIRGLMTENPKPSAIWPYGYGESMLHPELFDIIGDARSKGIVVSLSTNGTHLNEVAGRELLASGLDFLIVAFDGATPETYAHYRKGADFHQVKANVEGFLRQKLKRNSSLHLTLQMILMRRTADEVAAFKRLWTKQGVDCVRIREDLLKNHELHTSVRKPKRHRPCFFLWRGPLFVQAAGTVIPCPYYHGSPPFADLRTQSVKEAWNSPKMRELREAHVSGDVSKFPVCANCPRYQPHALVAGASFFVSTKGIRKYLPAAERIQQKLGRKLFE